MRRAFLVCLLPSLLHAVDYERDIKPLLHERCYACHGALKQKAGLRLDTVTLMRQGGDDGDILSGAAPLIVQRVTTTDKHDLMPPEGEGARLSEEQVALLQEWIAAGAPGPDNEQPEPDPHSHWAYQIPEDQGQSADALIEKKLAARGLKAQPPAAPETWLRRVYLDLIGLPPAPEEIREFTGADADARAQVVDRLLSSPHYGERWGRHFMDIWRYSDWYGLGAQLRHSHKHLWRWRDWIVESLNADKGYDEMIVQMLAADELAPEDRDNLRATGFLARGYYLFNRTTWLDDTIEHTCRAFLGLTMQCVKCHDHKYDPVEQAEYYQMRAIFEPLHVRLDPVPGVTDFEKDGLPRVFDLHLDRPTWRHVRGDEKNEDKSKAHTPAVPVSLKGAPFDVQAVKLPAATARPLLLPFVLEDHLRAAEAETEEARNKFVALEATAPGQERLKPAHQHQKTELQLARLTLALAEAKPAWLRAVHAAESQPDDKKLAAQAAAADARRLLAHAELDLFKAEQSPDLKESDAKKKAAAEKKLTDARAALVHAKKNVKSPGQTYTLVRASLKAQEGPDDPGNAEVQQYPETSTGRRLALARWIADERNPLTARVLVNHVWLRHFGAPLVADVSDFGRRSPAPLHQDVLDTLAARFMANGWSLKWLHRELVLSQSYARLSSLAGADAGTLNADPDNLHYWRMNPRRMESQIVRDSLLHLSGRLDPALGGPTLDPVKLDTRTRRSLYFNQTAHEQNAFLGVFDNASVLECYRREESVAPQQALALVNSRASHDNAQALAGRLSALDEAAFIRESFLAILGRVATREEEEASRESLAILTRPLFLQALFNHNDFVTLR